MSYFKHSKNTRKPGNVEGFITKPSHDDLSSNTGMHSKFRTSYRPTTRNSNNDLPKVDGFIRRQPTVESAHKPLEQSEEFIERPAHAQVDSESSTKNKKFNLGVFRRSKSKSKGKSKKPLSKFKKVSRATAVLLIALVIGVGSLFAYGYLRARNIFKGDGEGAAALQEGVEPEKLNGEGDGRVNILLIGKGGEGHDGADLTDTLLLASIDPVQNEVALVSVPRDLYVETATGYETKINAVYSLAKQSRLANGDDADADIEAAEDAGLEAIKANVSNVLGVPVHYYTMVDFAAFEDAVNTVGGITIDVKDPVYEQMWLNGGPYTLDVSEGLQTFDGTRALAYSRCRHCDNRSDFGRTERQRQVVVALQQKVLSLGTFANPFTVLGLLDNLGSHVRTDLNGLNELRRLYEIGQNISSDKVTSIGLADPPNILVRTGAIGNQSVVMPTEGLFQYNDIRSYIRNTIRDPFLKREDARVLILNGTEVAGLATATMEELKSYGYNVVGVDNAPTSNYVQNLLIDNTNGEKRYTKSYLEKRVGLSATTTAPEGVPGIDQADFVIILGTDEVNKTAN